MPMRTFQRRIAGNRDIALIQVSVRDESAIDRVKSAIERLMRERRHLAPNEENDFSVLDTRQITQTLTGTTRILTLLLSAVAAVSLLVGGIGIMNIMLVSVTERTREIGIRLAIGAYERDVLTQFLVEAVVLASFGGLFGVLLALATSAVLAQVLQVPFILNPGIMILAFLFWSRGRDSATFRRDAPPSSIPSRHCAMNKPPSIRGCFMRGLPARNQRSERPCLATAFLVLILCGCSAVGPDYRKPEIAVPAEWGKSCQVA
jgi:hypothetical protein